MFIILLCEIGIHVQRFFFSFITSNDSSSRDEARIKYTQVVKYFFVTERRAEPSIIQKENFHLFSRKFSNYD